ncbi:class I SAM-dependent methyltransferase [Sphingomonas sp. BT-65]|uniref:class I SAM-dependent methyltransferase n=1 Tax=Sphingomonas sp. BT-65 TaxID=2989821 RepID=UPI00223619D1|nr:class I SAM-dependent methyltransferase [Sphingomonas sp. BT-65]MCW4461660.1 class I SAM-dependent methyltransferase [Sphingomonas sp. BT-65]
MLQQLHEKLVFGRRVRRLAAMVAERLPRNARVLDVGAGSGDLAQLVMALRPDVQIEGVDVLVRPDTAILVHRYDGVTLPFEDGSFDAAVIIDVLHHTDNPGAVMAEAARVAKRLVVKDHFRDGFAAGFTLRLMDWVGNAAHGVRLPYNYLSRREWIGLWDAHGLSTDHFADRLGLYPRPFGWLFDRKLHFVTILQRAAA